VSQWGSYSNSALPLLLGAIPTESMRSIAGGRPGMGGGVVDISISRGVGDLGAIFLWLALCSSPWQIRPLRKSVPGCTYGMVLYLPY